MDHVFIRDLALRCIIGVGQDERREKQDVLINIAIGADLKRAGTSDRFEDAIDYRAVKKEIVRMVESSGYYLIEALAEAIAAVCLEHAGVTEVRVQVDKPSALRFARSVAVEITRKKGG